MAMLKEQGMAVMGYEPSPAARVLAPPEIRASISDTWCEGWDLVICREVLEHLTVRQAAETIHSLFEAANKAVYITTRFHPSPSSVFDVTDERDVDPTHSTLLTQPFLRSLCVLAGGKRRRDWEIKLDWQQKGRCLCYEVTK